VIEHVDDDERALAELSRVAVYGAALITSVPLHPAQWSGRRFVGQPAPLRACRTVGQASHDTARPVERSAAFRDEAEIPAPVRLGMWFLIHQRAPAIRLYNRVMIAAGRALSKTPGAGTGA